MKAAILRRAFAQTHSRAALLHAALIVAFTLRAIAQAPPPAADPAHVQGRILNVAGQPLAAAQVNLQITGAAPATRGAQPFRVSTVTGPQGEFTLETATFGRFTLSAEKTGFLTRQLGASDGVPPTNLTLAAGQTVKDLIIRLIPAASIAGRVVDRSGNPIPKAQVNAFRYQYLRGARTLNPAGYAITADASGVYRFPSLTAGRYYLRVESSGDSVATYYPSTTDYAGAAPIDVEAGSERSGVDISPLQEPVFAVRGKAVDEKGDPAVNAALYILPEKAVETQTPYTRVPTLADGSFEFKNLLPGNYVLRAIPNGNVVTAERQLAPARYAGRMAVTVRHEDVSDVQFPVNAGANLAGALAMEDRSALPIPTVLAGVISQGGLRVMLIDAEQTFTSGDLSGEVDAAGGQFRIEHILPGKYYLNVRPVPANVYYIKSIRYAGQDLTRAPLDLTYGGGDNLQIVLGTKAGEVRATVRNRNGDLMPQTAVTLWPDIADLGSPTAGVRFAFTDEMGTVRFAGLRPEKYRIAAWQDVEQAFSRSPDFLQQFKSRATEVAVEEGSAQSYTLEPIGRTDSLAVIRTLP